MKKGNADIRGFFKPRPASSDANSQSSNSLNAQRSPLPQDPPSTDSSLSSLSSPSIEFRSPSLPPLQTTPPPRAPLRKVVADSEDDMLDDDDIDDLPSLLPPSRVAAKPRPANPCITPKAKRTAIPDFSTPMSIRQKHAFDFKTLLAHEDEHQKSMATRKMAEDALDADEDVDTRHVFDSPRKFASPRHISAKETRREIVKRTIPDDVDAARNAERALENVNAGDEKPVWYFFDPDPNKDHPIPDGPDFPDSAPDIWKRLLGNAASRPNHLGSGLPGIIATKIGLPTEVFEWILAQLPCEPHPTCRDHYTGIMLAVKGDSKTNDTCITSTHITPMAINNLFLKLGAQVDLDDRSELVPFVELKDAYKGRDWSVLISILRFLEHLAPHLRLPARIKTSVAALRLSADEAVMHLPGVRGAFHGLIKAVAESCPETEWEQFCQTVFETMFSLFKEPVLQVQVINSLLIATERRTHNLRKLLASVFLFRDPSPSNITLRDFSDRLQDKDLKPSRDADYASMRDIVVMWEAALDDAFRGTNNKSRPSEEFNAEIDELIEQVNFLQTSVKSADAGAVARLQMKEFLVGLASRLQLIRTVPQGKNDLYDEARQTARTRAKDEEQKKKQKALMGKFLSVPKN